MNEKKRNQQNKKVNSKKLLIEIGKFLTNVAAAATIAQFLVTWNNEQVEGQRRLLHYAEEYYEEGNYEAVADVLSNDTLRNNELVPLNIGVMYAKGLYFSVNEERACTYFREAFGKGEKYYSIQYLLCYLDSIDDCDEIRQLVLAGCNNNNGYLEKLFEMLYAEYGLECEEKYIEDFKKRNKKEQLEILNTLFAQAGEVSYKIAKEYEYTVYTNEEGENEVEAEVTEKEEKVIDVYIRRCIGKESIEMIFMN